MIEPKLSNCAFCNCKLSIGERFLCTDCYTDGRNLIRKAKQMKQWEKILDEKLEVVKKLVDEIEQKVSNLRSDEDVV